MFFDVVDDDALAAWAMVIGCHVPQRVNAMVRNSVKRIEKGRSIGRSIRGVSLRRRSAFDYVVRFGISDFLV